MQNLELEELATQPVAGWGHNTGSSAQDCGNAALKWAPSKWSAALLSTKWRKSFLRLGHIFSIHRFYFLNACMLFSKKLTVCTFLFKKEKQGTSLSQRKAIRQTTGGTSTISVCLWARQREREQEDNFFRDGWIHWGSPYKEEEESSEWSIWRQEEDSNRCDGVYVMMGGGGHSKNLDSGVFGFFIGT